MKLNLTNLQPGDVLVCRDGTRRMFRAYVNNYIDAREFVVPSAWGCDGRHPSGDRAFAIVRVIRNRQAKTKPAKDDADARWLTQITDDDIHNWFKSDIPRLRRIATRLNGGMKVKP